MFTILRLIGWITTKLIRSDAVDSAPQRAYANAPVTTEIPRTAKVLGETERDAVWQLSGEATEFDYRSHGFVGVAIYGWRNGRWCWSDDAGDTWYPSWAAGTYAPLQAPPGQHWVEVLPSALTGGSRAPSLGGGANPLAAPSPSSTNDDDLRAAASGLDALAYGAGVAAAHGIQLAARAIDAIDKFHRK